MNPFEPAALSLGDAGVEARIRAGNSPINPRLLTELVKDPAKMELLTKIMLADAEERQRTGETPEQQAMRERREWAEADARSDKLKAVGNKAFKEGEYEKAFIVYCACAYQSAHEPLYRLNRAAAALKLGLYTKVFEDVQEAIDREYMVAKAHYRRAQANRALGRWAEAKRDLEVALRLAPGDPNVLSESAELERVVALPEADRVEWLKSQNAREAADLYSDSKEFARLVQEQIDLSRTL